MEIEPNFLELALYILKVADLTVVIVQVNMVRKNFFVIAVLSDRKVAYLIVLCSIYVTAEAIMGIAAFIKVVLMTV